MSTGMIFYLAFLVPSLGYSWLSCILPCAIVAALPVVGLIKEDYNRTNLDSEETGNTT
jgi:hypothetical protein